MTTRILVALRRRIYGWLNLDRSRVTAVWCPICDRWVKPFHFRTPVNVCRDCAPVVQPPIRRTVLTGRRPVHSGGRR